MPYVQRGEAGRIMAASEVPSAVATEWLEPGHPELLAFALGSPSAAEAPAQAALVRSDQGFIRVLEDLIDTLLDKDVIRFTDLPSGAQKRLLERRSLRASMNSLKLLDEDGGSI